jgi:hypothetical protein
MSAPTVVQSGIAMTTGHDATITLSAPPTVGNVIVAMVYELGTGVNTAYWTSFGVSSPAIEFVYHYVQVGDTALLGEFSLNPESGYYGAAAWEIAGLGRTWSTNLDQTQVFGFAHNATTATTTALTSANANELALVLAACHLYLNNSTPITIAAPWATDQAAEAYVTNGASGHNAYPTASASVSATVTFPGGANQDTPVVGIVLLLNGTAPPATQNAYAQVI